MRSLKKILGIVAVALIVGGCGGGGGSGGSGDTPNNNLGDDGIEPRDNVVFIDDASQDDIKPNIDQNYSELIVSDSFIKKIAKNQIISIAPETNENFPFGLSARVKEIKGNRVILEPITLADMFKKLKTQKSVIDLKDAKFLGVIESGLISDTKKAKFIRYDKIVDELNLSRVEKTNEYKLKKISKTIPIDLYDLHKDRRTNTKEDHQTSGELVLSIDIDNLKIEESHNFVFTNPTESTLDFKVLGDVSAKIELNSDSSWTFGRYNHAWNEVKESSHKWFGGSDKITGLDSKDKVGKYPLIGFLFTKSIKPDTYVGKTQTPVRKASKVVGIIVWVNFIAKGELDLHGTVGMSSNFSFETGIKRVVETGFSPFSKLHKTANKKIIEAPYIKGDLGLDTDLGLSIDVDLFAYGVRFLNASVVSKINGDIDIETADKFSLGVEDVGGSWNSYGSPICLNWRLGAGFIFGSSMRLGIKVNQFGLDWETEDDITYNLQYPSESELSDYTKEGWNKTWYSWKAGNKCFNELNNQPTSSPTSLLKKTGQTKSYDQNGNEVTDGSVKDDGYYQAGVTPNYTRDDSTGIVTDHVTGLMWQDNETVSKPWLTEENYDKCVGENGQTKDDTKCYDTNGDTASTYCANLRLGGYSDWRLPTRKELLGIVDYGRNYPAIDLAFNHTNGLGTYWSSTAHAYYLGSAWIVHSWDGSDLGYPKDNSYLVRCVREGK